MTLHIDQTSVSFPLKRESAKQLHSSLQDLLQTFAAKQKAERPQRWKSMEFRIKGEQLPLTEQPIKEGFVSSRLQRYVYLQVRRMAKRWNFWRSSATQIRLRLPLMPKH